MLINKELNKTQTWKLYAYKWDEQQHLNKESTYEAVASSKWRGWCWCYHHSYWLVSVVAVAVATESFAREQYTGFINKRFNNDMVSKESQLLGISLC